jgi:biotin carboxylase
METMSVSITEERPQAVVLINHRTFYSYSVALAVRARGYVPVIVTTDRNIESLHERPDAHIDMRALDDWSDESLHRALSSIERDYRIAGMYSSIVAFTGRGLLAAQIADIAESRGLPNVSSAAIWKGHNKVLFREAIDAHGLPNVAHAHVVDEKSLLEACGRIGFPLILKPITGAGSCFVYTCNNEVEAVRNFRDFLANQSKSVYAYAFEKHAPNIGGFIRTFDPAREMIAEAKIPGPELSVEVLCDNDSVHALIVHDKLEVEESRYCVYEHLLITPPVTFDDEMVARIEQYACDAVKAIGLRNSFAHVEMRIDPEKGPLLIEINPRLGGMMVLHSVESSAGMKYPEAIAKMALGLPINPPAYVPQKKHRGMMAIYPRKSGVLSGIPGIETAKDIPGVLELLVPYEIGESLGGDYEEVFAVSAFFHGESEEEIRSIDERLRKTIILDIA